jgi:hypothetical protein
MMERVEVSSMDLQPRTEAVARYLGAMFPTQCIDRYRDDDRCVVGFRFIGNARGNIEFSDDFLTEVAETPDGIAHELHLRAAGAEINATEPGQRLIFTARNVRREPIATA